MNINVIHNYYCVFFSVSDRATKNTDFFDRGSTENLGTKFRGFQDIQAS